MDKLDIFCHSAVNCVFGATRQERAALRAELREHMEDHAAALMESGLSEEEAAQRALDAMGEPEEIGRALNEQYPRHWKRLYYALVLLLVLAVPFFAYEIAAVAGQNIYTEMNTIQETQQSAALTPDLPGVQPMDKQLHIGNFVMRLCGISCETTAADASNYSVTLYWTIYPSTSIVPIWDYCKAYDDAGNLLVGADDSLIEEEPWKEYHTVTYSLPTAVQSLTVVYDHYGLHDEFDISLNRKEAGGKFFCAKSSPTVPPCFFLPAKAALY